MTYTLKGLFGHRGRRGHDRMVIVFTTTDEISAYQHCEFKSDFYVNLRIEVAKHPLVILAMYFLSWTRIMSVLIG